MGVESRKEEKNQNLRSREKEQKEERRRQEELEKFNAISDYEIDAGYQLVYRDEDMDEYLEYEEAGYYSDREDTEYGDQVISEEEKQWENELQKEEEIMEEMKEAENEVDNDTGWTPTPGSEFSTEEKNPGSVRSAGARGRALVFLEENVKE